MLRFHNTKHHVCSGHLDADIVEAPSLPQLVDVTRDRTGVVFAAHLCRQIHGQARTSHRDGLDYRSLTCENKSSCENPGLSDHATQSDVARRVPPVSVYGKSDAGSG